MKPGLKRGLKIAALVLVAVLAVPVSVGAATFAGMAPIEDGAELAVVARIVKDGIVSVGVIDLGDGKIALIDAGNDADGKAILADLARRKLGPEAVTTILLTHGHGDHLAACHLFPGAAIYALAADAELIEGRSAGHSPVSHLISAKPTGLEITRPLADGQTLQFGNVPVQVFAIPGHTAGSAAYLVAGVLFLGDSAGAKKDGTLEGAPWAFSDDQAQNRASLKALATRLQPQAEQVSALVPAHSGVMRGLGPLTAFAAAH